MTSVAATRRAASRHPRGAATPAAGASLLVPWLYALLATALCAFFATIGGDARWLAALGREIVHRGGIPDGVPYASAASAGWQNVPVLGELATYAVHSGLGDRGFLLLQVAALALAFGLVAADARRAGAGERGIAFALLVLAVAAFPALTIVRAQVFSLALFPVLLLLLRTEARAPSRRVWLLVPLVALWSNLHGAVLVGVTVAGAYLLLSRARRSAVTAASVLAATLLALCLTPSLYRTPLYYLGVLENESARRHYGLWARLSFDSGVDVVVIVGTLLLLAMALRARPAAWEIVALAGLAALTAQAGRNGVWLAAFAASHAARGLQRSAPSRARLASPLRVAFFSVAIVTAIFAFARGPLELTAGDRLVRQAIDAAHGTPILAENQMAEQVALAGGRVWIANPIDAFTQADQRAYLDWVEGLPSGDAALEHAPRAVLVSRGGSAERRLAADGGFRRLAADPRAVLYLRTAPASSS